MKKDRVPRNKPFFARTYAAPERLLRSASELKNIDNNLSTKIQLGTSGILTLLNGVQQGVGAAQRLGRRTIMKSLLIKIDVTLVPTTTGSSPLRFLVVYDAQANAAAPIASDVLAVDTIIAPMNLGNSRRFKTLCDIETPVVGTQGPQSYFCTRFVKMNLPVEFNVGSAGTIGDISTGSVYLLSYQDGGLGTLAPTANIYTRIRFADN